MTKPIAVYSICNSFGIEILDIDDYSDNVMWKWSNETKERSSSIQYNLDGEAYFMVGTENQVFLNECIKI